MREIKGRNDLGTEILYSAMQVEILREISMVVVVLSSLMEDVVAKLPVIGKALRDELTKSFATIMMT